MKFQKFILTMATLLMTGSAVAAGFDSPNTPVFTPGSAEKVQIKADLPQGTSALQFTVTVPEAFELSGESLVLNAQLTSKSHAEGEGKYNYVLYTDDNSAIAAGADWLFGLNLKAKTSAGKGTYALKFTNIIAATASGAETRIADRDVTLTVKIPVAQVSVAPATGSMLIGGTLQLTATVLPADAEQGVKWEVNNASVASVDANGSVHGVGVGTVRVTARSTDNAEVSGYCDVTVNPITVAGIALDKTAVNLRAGDKATLKATVTPADATNSKVTWASSDRSIVTVDDNGSVTTLKAGTATVTATTTDGTNLSASCTVTVLPPLATGVTLSKPEVSLTVRESVTLTATVAPAAAEQKVTWSTSDAKIATVDAGGAVTAQAAGSAVITATAADGSGVSASCKVTVTDAKVSSITLSKTALGMRIGQSETVTATALPEYAANRAVTWSSDKPAVATVDASGKITAVALGDATITATAADGSGVTATCTVTVTNALATGVSIDKTSATLLVNRSVKLTATVTPAGAVGAVNWSSDVPGVATVDKDGNVKAVSPGKAIITATTADGTNHTATCIITVEPVPAESVTLSATSWSGKVGEGVALTATVLPADATDKTVTWGSSNTAVATVDAAGNVKAVALGNAVITATCGSASASCNVTVVATPAESVTLSATSWSGKVGEGVALTATVLPADATDKTVTWSSSNAAVATVDAAGNVKAVALGNAVITATCGSASATCNVAVVATPAESVTLSATSWSGKVGEGVALTATVLPADATDKTVTWSSSNTAVATVDAAGNVKAVALGNAVITATCGSASASCNITVVATLIESLIISPETWDGIEGNSFTITATVLPGDATDKSLSWSSSDPEVATVDADGNVSVLKEGNCVIRVVTLDGSNLSAECIVTSQSGIEDIFADMDAKVDVYSLSGILLKHNCALEEVNQLAPGLYIIRSGRVSKIIRK